MIVKRWYDPVFRAYVRVAADCTIAELKKYMDARNIEFNEEGEFVEGLSFDVNIKDVQHYWIYLRDRRNFYTLSHEIIHMVKAIFRDRGIPFCAENDETLAYYHTYWLRKMWRAIG